MDEKRNKIVQSKDGLLYSLIYRLMCEWMAYFRNILELRMIDLFLL